MTGIERLKSDVEFVECDVMHVDAVSCLVYPLGKAYEVLPLGFVFKIFLFLFDDYELIEIILSVCQSVCPSVTNYVSSFFRDGGFQHFAFWKRYGNDFFRWVGFWLLFMQVSRYVEHE